MPSIREGANGRILLRRLWSEESSGFNDEREDIVHLEASSDGLHLTLTETRSSSATMGAETKHTSRTRISVDGLIAFIREHGLRL